MDLGDDCDLERSSRRSVEGRLRMLCEEEEHRKEVIDICVFTRMRA